MSYTPTEWHTGDIVTANKLNNLEQGVVDAQLPEYSASDNGKVLTIAEAGPQSVVVVPEQAIEDQRTPLTGVTISPTDIPIGTTALCVVYEEASFQTHEYECVYQYDAEHDAYSFYNENVLESDAVVYVEGNWYQFVLSGSGTLSLTASIPSVETSVIVPEQSVTTTADQQTMLPIPQLLTDTEPDLFTVGSTVNFTIDGTDNTCTVEETDGQPYISTQDADDHYCIVDLIGGKLYYTGPIGVTHTISITKSVPVVEPKWENIPTGLIGIVTPSDAETVMMQALSSRIASAVAAGKGVANYTAGSGTPSGITDRDSFETFWNTLKSAYENKSPCYLALSGRSVNSVTKYTTPNTEGYSVTYSYPIYQVSTYTLSIDVELNVVKNTDGVSDEGYVISSVITWLD